jgi:hypothetical protein
MKPATDTLAGAVSSSVAALDLEVADQATARLALIYAEWIDDLQPPEGAKLLGPLGRALSGCLEALGASPAARADIGRRVNGQTGESELERLRRTRRAG